jgi:hypothetical protein
MKALNTAIYSRLSSATALTSLLSGTSAIYATQAPEQAVYPYVVYSLQGGGDENMTANRTKNLVVFVRAYSKQSNAQAGSIDAQLDTALHMIPFTSVSGWANIWMAREDDLELVENPPTGGQIWMNGGLYRVRLDKD